MKIVFMGTPEIAASILDAIIQAGHQVVGVVTTPDKPAGRGQHIKFSEVKEYALSHNLLLLQPERMKEESFIQNLITLQADVFVVVAFRMLPQAVFTIPPKGTFNIHVSLLPQYRGAAPIQWAIINGETKTGVTSFFLDEHTDTGDIIRQQEVSISNTDNAGTLHDKLMAAGAEIAVATLKDIELGNIHPIKQNIPANTKLITAPKIFKEDMLINWNDTAENIYNKIRGLSPYPGAFSRIEFHDPKNKDIHKTMQLKIYKCSITTKICYSKPGTIFIENGDKMLVFTQNFAISVENLQIEGKKKMNISDFLKGFHENNYTLSLF